MSGSNSRRRRLPVVGVTTVGLAVTAGGVGLDRATAEPIQVPLLPVPISQPKEEAPAWAPAEKQPVVPAGGVKVPAVGLPTPALPAGVPNPVAPPARPAAPALPPPSIPGLLTSAPEMAPEPRPAPPSLPTPPLVGVQAPEVAPPAQPAKSPHPAPPDIPTPPENNLRSADAGFTVNPVGPSPAVPTPPPAADLPAPRLPVMAVPTAAAPADPLTTSPGDAPMPIPTRQLVMSAVLGTALAATPSYAQDDKEKAKTVDAADVKKQLDDIKTDVKQILALQKDLEAAVFGKADGKTDTGLVKRLGDLAEMIRKLDERLTAMEKKMDGTTSRTAERPPIVGAMTARAFVRLVNDYPVDVAMLVNGRSHRLLPGEVKTVEVPSGSYTYELLASGQTPTTSTLKDGETVTLRIK